MAEHRCDTGNFDRTICPEPCGQMHSYCSTCGKRQDACAHHAARPMTLTTKDAETLAGAVRREAEARAEAWDEGYETGYDDAVFDDRGLSTNPDAHEFPHANPYRAALAEEGDRRPYVSDAPLLDRIAAEERDR